MDTEGDEALALAEQVGSGALSATLTRQQPQAATASADHRV
ncbi:hypothetical protein ACQP1G_26350 [Nocardia sp. CA-107356]